MAGTIVANTLNTDTAGAVFTTANAMTGICKAWVLYNAVSQTITGSFNVSSVTYVGSGRFTVNMTTAMPNANYSIAMSTSSAGSGGSSNLYAYIDDLTLPRTTTSFRIISVISNGTAFFDTGALSAAVFSS